MHIGSLTLQGRIIMPPMATHSSTADGMVTDSMIEYYRKRAANPHVAMIITEHSYICQQGKARDKQMSTASDDCIPGLSRLAAAIHEGGALAAAQLNHAGGASPRDVIGGQALAASAVELPVSPKLGDPEPAEMTVEQIHEIPSIFAAAAVRAKTAGFDAVEIHSAHAYLLNQFFSPMTNLRSDEYGGSLENRLRLHREVIQAVRLAVGPDYPIFVRLGGCDYMEGGNTIQDAAAAAKILEKEDIQLLDLSGGMTRFTRIDHTEPGYFSDMSKAVKAAVSLPVMAAGGVETLADAQQLIDDQAADFIGVGRMLMKNADWECEDAV